MRTHSLRDACKCWKKSGGGVSHAVYAVEDKNKGAEKIDEALHVRVQSADCLASRISLAVNAVSIW